MFDEKDYNDQYYTVENIAKNARKSIVKMYLIGVFVSLLVGLGVLAGILSFVKWLFF
jgi:hypothetical protein